MMNLSELETEVSTKQASELLGVHESSAKRWCNRGFLAFRTTPGGHRRIQVSALIDYAREAKINCVLVSFADDAGFVWAGMEEARSQGRFEKLVYLMMDWTRRGESGMMVGLLDWMTQRQFGIEQILDEIMSPTMRSFGQEYAAGNLSIGDEHQMTHTIRDVLISWNMRSPRNYLGHQKGVAIVGCARGEVHEIGALMVRLLLEESGWKVVYLGLNVPTEEFADQQVKHRASLVCISMTPPAGKAEAHTIVSLLNRMYTKDHPFRLAIGGAAVHPEDKVTLGKLNFQDIEFFRTLSPFSKWVTT